MKKGLLALLLVAYSASYAQNNDYFLMPYRLGDKWGLCDTLGRVQVKPQYDGFIDLIVDTRTNRSFYFVRQNNRTIVIDHNNQQQLKEYDSINPLLSVVFKEGKGYTYSYNYGDGSQSFVVAGQSTQVQPIKTQGIKGNVVGDIDITTESSKKDPWVLGAQAYEKERLSIEKYNLSIVNKEASKEDMAMISPIVFTPITHYFYYKENGKMGITQFTHTLLNGKNTLVKHVMVPAEYDAVEEIDNRRVIVVKNGKYGIADMYNAKSPFTVAPAYDGIYYSKAYSPLVTGNTLVFKQGDKYAVFSKAQNKVVSGFEYDGYEFTWGRDSYYLILKKGSKKLLWDLDKQTPGTLYDDIVIEVKTFISGDGSIAGYDLLKFKKDGKWGVVDKEDAVVVPFEYDDILMETPYNFTTIKKSLKGFYDGPVNIPPKYKIVEEFKDISFPDGRPYKLFRVTDKDGVSFYVNSKGLEFYKK